MIEWENEKDVNCQQQQITLKICNNKTERKQRYCRNKFSEYSLPRPRDTARERIENYWSYMWNTIYTFSWNLNSTRQTIELSSPILIGVYTFLLRILIMYASIIVAFIFKVYGRWLIWFFSMVTAVMFRVFMLFHQF